jgi:hypothetical protein
MVCRACSTYNLSALQLSLRPNGWLYCVWTSAGRPWRRVILGISASTGR